VADRCLACLDSLGSDAAAETHAKCARALFGTSSVPPIELDPDRLYLFGQEMAGRITLSGVQSKVALGWHQRTLRVRAEDSAFILKPQSNAFPQLPENEHVCLLLAKILRLDVARAGLVRLRNGSLALVARRFDRRDDGSRVPMEDFCQLVEKLPRDKYDGSAELCARIVRRYSSEPGVDLLRVFRQVLFSWWIGNGDLHLKNLALLTATPGMPKLSPAYDLLSTGTVIPGDALALPVGGKRSRLDRTDWIAFAEYCGLGARLADREIDGLLAGEAAALELVETSFLDGELRARLGEILEARSRALET
jgi:serine/threonine-protein kinase HipA